ncbi:MAG: methylaspartate mutase subunit E [Deltaproteobacteria bacterium]|nr:MAG: methylaspartate mutase subunit E [Deltaproteobacteria bacterium]
MKIKNKRLTDDEFFQERKEVLEMWPTGGEVDLAEAIDFHKSLPPHKNFARKLLQARDTHTTLIRTDSGVPSVEEFSKYLRYLQDEGQTDLLGTMVDSMTRSNRYEDADQGLRESLKTGKWALNGFPLVTHGVHGTRRLIEEVNLPVMVRGIAPDYRLIDEIGFAGGHTATSGSPLIALCQYSRNIPLEVVIRNYQYVYRLIGYYGENGVPLAASTTGGFAILCPFSVLIAGAILDSFIAAEQGVKTINLSINTQGNVIQDVASVITLRKTANEYLEALGYKDVETTINCTNWSGKFPDDIFQASAIISLGVFAAVASKSEIATVKTIEEAKTIPRREANAATLRLGKTLINILKDQGLQLDQKAVETEAKMLEMETKAIVDKVLDQGDGDAAIGEVKAVQSGVFDVPFAASQYVPCKVKGIRDNQGMVRYIDHGNLPFTNEIVAFHKEKIAERERSEGRRADYQTIVEDLSSISKGLLTGSA